MQRLLHVAREEKLGKVVGDILPDNSTMLRVCEKLGFRISGEIDDPVLRAELDLGV